MIQHDSQGLEPVTTASLQALQLYPAAAARSGGDDAQVDELLSAALREDPQFASAYIGLAWACMMVPSTGQSLFGHQCGHSATQYDTRNRANQQCTQQSAINASHSDVTDACYSDQHQGVNDVGANNAPQGAFRYNTTMQAMMRLPPPTEVRLTRKPTIAPITVANHGR